MVRRIAAIAAVVTPVLIGTAFAGEADVLNVELTRMANGAYSIDVTVQHADDGWDHYADGWSVSTPDGVELGYRVLHHPHVNEQPFSRTLGGLDIPDNVTHVTVRAHDSIHEWGGAEMTVEVPRQ